MHHNIGMPFVPPRDKHGVHAGPAENLLHSGHPNLYVCPSHLKTPANIQLIGNEVAIIWSDGQETYFQAPALRAASPSAETRGEKDIFGRQYGGGETQSFSNVQVLSWERVGNYALRFDFSDGHRTGLYSYDYLLELAARH